MDLTALLATMPFGANLPFGAMAPGNPGGAAPGGWMTNYLPAPGGDAQPNATALPGAPTGAPAPSVGILNGASPPPSSFGPVPNMGNPIRPNPLAPDYNLNLRPALQGPSAQSGQNMGAAFSKLADMVNPKMQAPQALPQIQMARPVGAGAGIDPMRLIAAMRGGM